MSAPLLHADAPPLRTLMLAVGDGHLLQVQEFGRADGIAALVLHGGPGSGCSPLLRRVFDPDRYRVICVDQRGSGGSRPRGSIAHNTTNDLIRDLKTLREHLGVRRWLVAGGSWGAALALAYAAAEPDAIAALLLRSSFHACREEIDWFFGGAAAHRARAWQRLIADVAVADHTALLPVFARRLRSDDEAARQRVARAWWCWEQALAHDAHAPAPPEGAALAVQIDRYRVQSHYLLHDCWLTAPSLLERCEAVPHVPTAMLHARDDLVCRARGALALHARLPQARLRWLDAGGHDPAHPAMVGATVGVLDHYARTGDFGIGP